jgi:hypothetical protein
VLEPASVKQHISSGDVADPPVLTRAFDMTNAKVSLQLALLAFVAIASGCSSDGSTLAMWRSKADSIGVLNTQLKARAEEAQQASVEKDTLITTLQTAMEIASEIEKLQKEVVGKPARTSKNAEGVVSWDVKVRSEIADIRKRHREMRDQLARAQTRLKEMSAKNTAMATNFEHALQTIEELQAKTAQQDVYIQELVTRIGGLEKENLELVTDKNRVYWIAATKDSLRKVGVIKQQGGKSLLLTRVGETFTPGDALDPALFHTIDKSRDNQISLPDNAEYEIVSAQNVAFVDSVIQKKRRVKNHFTIKDPKFWDNSKFLILMRR